MTPMGLITCVLIPRPAQQNQSGLPSTFPLQSHGEGLWWDTAGMASHRRLREAQAAAQPPNPAHSNSRDWSWSSAELPGQALSKGQVTHPPLSLQSPAAQHRWDNHRHPRLPHLCSSSPTGERRSNTASTPVVASVGQRGIFYKETQRMLRARATKTGPRFFNVLQ